MRSRCVLAAGLGFVLGLAVVSAQDKPNFSGRWIAVSPADSAGQEQVVRHDAKTLTAGHASEGHGHKASYTLDGTESRNVLVSHGENIVTLSKASWNGNKLTITSDTTYPDGRTWHTEQTWSLDASGRLVIDFTESGTTPSPVTRTTVYTRRP